MAEIQAQLGEAIYQISFLQKNMPMTKEQTIEVFMKLLGQNYPLVRKKFSDEDILPDPRSNKKQRTCVDARNGSKGSKDALIEFYGK